MDELLLPENACGYVENLINNILTDNRNNFPRILIFQGLHKTNKTVTLNKIKEYLISQNPSIKIEDKENKVTLFNDYFAIIRTDTNLNINLFRKYDNVNLIWFHKFEFHGFNTIEQLKQKYKIINSSHKTNHPALELFWKEVLKKTFYFPFILQEVIILQKSNWNYLTFHFNGDDKIPFKRYSEQKFLHRLEVDGYEFQMRGQITKNVHLDPINFSNNVDAAIDKILNIERNFPLTKSFSEILKS